MTIRSTLDARALVARGALSAAILATLASAQQRPTFLTPARMPAPIPSPVVSGATAELTGLQVVVAHGAVGAPRDLQHIARADHLTPFALTQEAAALNSPADEAGGAMTAMGDALYFPSSRGGGSGAHDLFVGRRLGDQGAFGSPRPVGNVNSPQDELDPFVDREDTLLLLASDRPGSLGGSSIWVSVRSDASSPWSTPLPIVEIDSPQDERGATLTSDGLDLFFASNRPGGAGGFDLYVAHRPDAGTPFGTPVPLTELNTPDDELRLELPFASRTGYLTRSIQGVDQAWTADLDAVLLLHSGDPGLGEPHAVMLGAAANDLGAVAVSSSLGTPITLPGFQGSLQLGLASLAVVNGGLADPYGYLTFQWSVPQDPSLVGLQLHFQGVASSAARGRAWFSAPISTTILPASMFRSCSGDLKDCAKLCAGVSVGGLVVCALIYIPTWVSKGFSAYAKKVASCVGAVSSTCFEICLGDYLDCKY